MLLRRVILVLKRTSYNKRTKTVTRLCSNHGFIFIAFGGLLNLNGNH